MDKLRDSLWLNYDREGLTLSAERFKKGKLNGKRVVFYLRNQIERGELKILSETTYRDSLKEGPFRTFFSSEKLKLEGQYIRKPHTRGSDQWNQRKYQAIGRNPMKQQEPRLASLPKFDFSYTAIYLLCTSFF